ncbi:uncharacterized protein FIBRA_08615 [Fibroporia radiculosa]|uniref:Cytosol aminopeptidase domain-containing protein n=1 Tax=Fibroporia radiculosa TaxID=599839 RepID=J4GHU4_9APHY|nr:uncharacterized protein FIBRA_08615 [Fibroporia radiculosa]CCM06358.1 predicted protein [Fibroporia radiculosa]
MLSRPSSRLLSRSLTLPHRRALGSTSPLSAVYLLPLDPQAPAANGQALADVDTARLWSAAPRAEKPAKAGTTHLFYATPTAEDVTALASLGGCFASTAGDERRELVRKAVGSAVKQVSALGEGVHGQTVHVDASADPHAAAVAAHLALYEFTLKTDPPSPFNPRLTQPLPDKLAFEPLAQSEAWNAGVVYAMSQNLARTLSEMPGNMMTPTIFAERIKSEFAGIPNVNVIVRDAAWAAEQNMNTFLSVAKGSSEPAKFLEMQDVRPILFVGKGITFDSGGISIKPSAGMKLMRGDMGGAAAVCSAALAIAQLRLPVNLKVVAPLSENLPGPSAMKPGDVVYAMNGKSVEIDNTDAEGRLVLADALYYGTSVFQPHTVVDVATLTGAMHVALGEVFTGVFTVRAPPPLQPARPAAETRAAPRRTRTASGTRWTAPARASTTRSGGCR